MRGCILRFLSVPILSAVLASCTGSGERVRASHFEAHDRRAKSDHTRDESRFWERFGPESPAALAVADNTVVAVGARGEVVEYQREPDEVRWSAHLELPSVSARPAISASTVLVTGGDEAVAVDRASGAVRWRVPVPGAGAISYPGGDAGTFLVTSGGASLLALDEQSGSRRWSSDFDSSFSFGMAATSGTVLVLDGSTSGARLRAFEGTTGTVRWARTLPPSDSIPAASEGRFVVAVGDSRGGSVLALDASSGQPRWQVDVRGGIGPRGRPVVDARSVALLDARGTLHLLDAADGRERWSKRVAESGTGTLRLSPSGVLLTEADGTLELDRRTGAESTEPVFMGALVDEAVLGDAIVRLVDVGGSSSVELRPA